MTDTSQIKRIAIVGGGTAGWMAASILARALPGTQTRHHRHRVAGHRHRGRRRGDHPADRRSAALSRASTRPTSSATRKSTYKLGIKFTDWSRIGESYWHPFGTFGSHRSTCVPSFTPGTRARAAGLAPRFNDFSLCAALGDARQIPLSGHLGQGPAAGLRYALHFDAGLVAKYLRTYAERLGVTRLERTVADATLRADGFLDELVFADGTRLQADLYIDCSGFRGVLIEQALKTGYIDWSDVLPCDRAVAMPTELASAAPALHASQRAQRRLALAHSAAAPHRATATSIAAPTSSDDAGARRSARRDVGERPLAEPRFLRFTTGRRKLFWNRNCVALGLASGFLEPLESTSIHLVMSGVYKLLEHFPDRSFAQANIDSYNNELISEIERIRDFIVLHYCLTERTDTPLWAYCRAMKLPDSLLQRIELYRRTGRMRIKAGELFTDLSLVLHLRGHGRAAGALRSADGCGERRPAARHFLTARAGDRRGVPRRGLSRQPI